MPPDAGVGHDAGSVDTGGADSSVRDSSSGDSASVESSAVDATRPDATPPDASLSDAVDDRPVLPFCQGLVPTPIFCEDFDEGLNNLGTWSYIHMSNGALANYYTAFSSSPSSMQALTDVVTSFNASVDTAVYRDFCVPGEPTNQNFCQSGPNFSGTLDLDLRVDQVDSSTGVAVVAQFGLTDGSGHGQYFLQFVINSNGADPLSCVLNEDYFATSTDGSPTGHPISANIPLNMWVHVKLQMAVPFAGGAGTATAVIEGGAPNTASIKVPVANFTPSIGVGLTYASTPSNGWTVLIDNVVFNATTN